MANVLKNRDERIMSAAIEIAKSDGYQWITRELVAKSAGCAPSSVNNAFGTVVELKRAVLRYAVEHEIVEIVAQGLADKHPIATAAPAALKEAAAIHLAMA